MGDGPEGRGRGGKRRLPWDSLALLGPSNLGIAYMEGVQSYSYSKGKTLCREWDSGWGVQQGCSGASLMRHSPAGALAHSLTTVSLHDAGGHSAAMAPTPSLWPLSTFHHLLFSGCKQKEATRVNLPKKGMSGENMGYAFRRFPQKQTLRKGFGCKLCL